MNLLEETKYDIERVGLKIEDIAFIGSETTGHSCKWEKFKILADKEYDSGFGGQEVAVDLIIVFKNGTKMWRKEYDGSECWEYSKPFRLPGKLKKLSNLFAHQACESLEEIDEAQPEKS